MTADTTTTPRSVSLVATVLNEAVGIHFLLESIEAQSRRPDEVIITDGGSSDGTSVVLKRWADGRPDIHIIEALGTTISEGRNLAIARATGDIIAVTDAGVRLEPTWLQRIVEPLESDSSASISSGFFVADPVSRFERAIGATVLPSIGEIDPRRFLPSSRSVAFRREAWESVGGYPEWLDYCEDLVFDRALKDAGYRFVWTPSAVVRFRPRGSLRAFFFQYFRYARGDGKADLWRGRHAIRYGSYLSGAALLFAARRSPIAAGVLAAGATVYLGRPIQRLLRARRPTPDLVAEAALIPVIRVVGDLAKMAGYPMGVAWRLSRRTETRQHEDLPAPALAPASCDISVIIVSFNTRGRLRGCLASIERGRRPAGMETFVVDNASDDGSPEMVVSEFPWVKLIRSPINGGYAYANNLALRVATGRKLLLLNPDTEVSPDAITDLISYMDAHPEVGAVGPKLILGDGSLDLACRRSFPSPSVAFYRMAGLSRIFPRSRRFGRYNLTYLDSDVETEVDALSGACMLLRREAIEQVGLLDERFFMYGEDLDWAFRIKSRGWAIRYNPRVVVVHYKGEASRQTSERATVAFYRAMHLFYAKHYRGTAHRALDWVIVAGIYGRMGWSLARNALRPRDHRRVTT